MSVVEELEKKYSIQKIQAPEFSAFEMSGMHFTAEGYEMETAGHLSVMKAEGPMKMESVIVNPFEKDAPLFSIDHIILPDQQMLYMEQYDTLLQEKRKEDAFWKLKEKYASIPDIPVKENWYDQVRYSSSVVKRADSSQTELLEKLIQEYSETYLEVLSSAPLCDKEKKKKKADEYRDGLLNHGGPAADGFLKTWGKEKTEEFFVKVLFG